jgi:hypothetical protein
MNASENGYHLRKNICTVTAHQAVNSDAVNDADVATAVQNSG